MNIELRENIFGIRYLHQQTTGYFGEFYMLHLELRENSKQHSNPVGINWDQLKLLNDLPTDKSHMKAQHYGYTTHLYRSPG